MNILTAQNIQKEKRSSVAINWFCISGSELPDNYLLYIEGIIDGIFNIVL